MKRSAFRTGVDFHLVQEELLHFANCYKNGDLAIWKESEDDANEGATEDNEEKNEDTNSTDEEFEDADETSKSTDCGKCVPCIFKFLRRYNLHSAAYTNLYILYKYVLTLSCTQVHCERSFSKLKIIKNRLRASMGQDLLQAQLLISIEGPHYLNNIKIDTIIDEIARTSPLLKRLLLL